MSRKSSTTAPGADGHAAPPDRGAGAALAAHWVAVVIAVAAIAFIAQNRTSVSIQLFWLTIDAPMWFVLVCTVATGALIGFLGSRRSKPAADKKK
jgi:uncharacterized integral membrane protein